MSNRRYFVTETGDKSFTFMVNNGGASPTDILVQRVKVK